MLNFLKQLDVFERKIRQSDTVHSLPWCDKIADCRTELKLGIRRSVWLTMDSMGQVCAGILGFEMHLSKEHAFTGAPEE